MNGWTQLTSLRKLKMCILGLFMLGLVVVTTLLAGSTVWATPQRSSLYQTIPTLTPTPVPNWIWIGQSTGSAVDYAPSGVPDFDERQDDWRGSAAPAAWTHCGPLAVADVLWWLDSRFEPGHAAPPAVSDGCPLVTSFASWDDHDARNVSPLVSDLAVRLNTNGASAGSMKLGTDVSVLVPALHTYVADKGLQETCSVTVTVSPTFEQLLRWVRRGDGVVLLLGFWEWQGDVWVYLGGHYVAVAGVEPANRFVAISDPYYDAFEAGETVLGRSPVTHAHTHTVDVHNDAQYVSQDAYRVVPTEGPGGDWALADYARDFELVQNFVGQSVAEPFQSYVGPYGGAAITTKMDYALVLSCGPSSYLLLLPVILKGGRWTP